MKRTTMKRLNTKPSALPTRSKKLADHWNCTHLLTEPLSQFDQVIKKLDSEVSKFEARRGGLAEDNI